MDDSSGQANARQTDGSTKKDRIPFGMNSFDSDAQVAFGQELRVFMACKDGAAIPPASGIPGKAMPDEPSAIARRLKQVGQDITSGTADQLELLVRFDDLEGWKSSGFRHCAAWMNMELGISLPLGWEYLRVGRKLRTLPITRALFRAGRLTWSIIRLLSRVADKDNEALLCHTALDASVSDIERFCNNYRWQQAADENGTHGENARSLQQIGARSFTWNTISNGNTLIKLSLPPDVAQALLNSVEQSLAQLEDSDATMPQRRADAAVLMAERSLQNAGREIATADRYQVIVSVDSSELRQPTQSDPHADVQSDSMPAKRPTVHGAGSIATDTARRIACDCSVSTITHCDGEPVDIGRKSRLWPPAMARAIKHRDQHCQFPGCNQTRHLQIHHIQHWADGGNTCVENGCCLCSHHHSVVHEGGYRIECVNDKQNGANELFQRQQPTKYTFNDVESLLRNSRESFELVRTLSPTRFRFRVLNQNGQDIQNIPDDQANSESGAHSTHVEHGVCNQWLDSNLEAKPRDWPGVAETAGIYGVG